MSRSLYVTAGLAAALAAAIWLTRGPLAGPSQSGHPQGSEPAAPAPSSTEALTPPAAAPKPLAGGLVATKRTLIAPERQPGETATENRLRNLVRQGFEEWAAANALSDDQRSACLQVIEDLRVNMKNVRDDLVHAGQAADREARAAKVSSDDQATRRLAEAEAEAEAAWSSHKETLERAPKVEALLVEIERVVGKDAADDFHRRLFLVLEIIDRVKLSRPAEGA